MVEEEGTDRELWMEHLLTTFHWLDNGVGRVIGEWAGMDGGGCSL